MIVFFFSVTVNRFELAERRLMTLCDHQSARRRSALGIWVSIRWSLVLGIVLAAGIAANQGHSGQDEEAAVILEEEVNATAENAGRPEFAEPRPDGEAAERDSETPEIRVDLTSRRCSCGPKSVRGKVK